MANDANGNTPADGGTPQNQTPNPAGGGQKPGDGGQPDTGAGGGGQPGGGEKVYTFKEDRTDWTPRTRLNEESTKRTKAEQERDGLKTQLEQTEKRLRALAGVEPKDEKAEEVEGIKAAMLQMFPQLKTLESLDAAQLQKVFSAAKNAQSTSEAQWERHATSMLNDLDSEVSKSLGVEKLTETQQRHLRRAYQAEAATALSKRPIDERTGEPFDPTGNDFLSRHEKGDKTLLREFAKAFLDDWYEPARRSVTAAQARRGLRPVPRGERTRQIPAGGAPKVDLSNDADFKKALLAARGGGVQE